MLRVILLASLLGPLAAAPAPARDLRRGRDAPPEKGCEAFGPGFVKVEGTGTCVKVTGDLQAEVRVQR